VGAQEQEIYDVVLGAQLAALAAVRPGVSGSVVDASARDLIAEAGYGDLFGHGTGHGVGLEIHELPRLGRTVGDTLAAGMVHTVEPGIYLEGRFGVRIEDTVLVTEAGCERLTVSDKELLVVA
jgi:Xaa-Pro aminopeptidase